jgi:magnesium-transporting ATPase (P-type)
MSKRSVYLLPAYPFISIFIAQYVLYLTEYKKTISRIFSVTIGVVACLLGLIVLLTISLTAVDLLNLASTFTSHEKTLNSIDGFLQSLHTSKVVYVLLLSLLIYAIYILFKHFRKKNYLKTLYATIGAYLAILLILDGVFFPAYKDSVSIKPFAKHLKQTHPIREDNLFVMNNLLEYSNMYGLNFYFHNHFRNFEKELPDEGFLIAGSNSFKKIAENYGRTYSFVFVEEYNNKCRDGEKVIQFFRFKRKGAVPAIAGD